MVAAYLMKTMELDPMDAVEMVKAKRPVVECVSYDFVATKGAYPRSPSETFWYQLGLFYNADGRVSLRDRSTRQYYMERTTSQFLSA